MLPLLLSLAAVGLFRWLAGARHAAAGLGLAVLLATIWMMGWTVQPSGVMQKLAWIFAGAWLLGTVLDAASRNRLVQWVALTCAWLLACWWLGGKGVGSGILYGIAGALILACLLQTPDDRAEAVTTAVMASLGLAGLSFLAGSLALFQLSLLLAASLGGLALWLWPTVRVRFGATGVAVAGIGWLALAQANLLLVPARPGAMALLALSFLAAPLLARRWSPGRPRGGPLAAALLAGTLSAGALAIQAGSGAALLEDGKDGNDEGYYRK